MKKTGRRMFRLALLASITMLITAFAPAANAAPPTSVDFTIQEVLPLSTPGTLVGGSIPSCATPSVATPSADLVVTTNGNTTRFAGTKIFTCASGDTFTVSFSARVKDCSMTDSGTWRLTAGTGAFVDASGSGQLMGTYLSLIHI